MAEDLEERLEETVGDQPLEEDLGFLESMLLGSGSLGQMRADERDVARSSMLGDLALHLGEAGVGAVQGMGPAGRYGAAMAALTEHGGPGAIERLTPQQSKTYEELVAELVGAGVVGGVGALGRAVLPDIGEMVARGVTEGAADVVGAPQRWDPPKTRTSGQAAVRGAYDEAMTPTAPKPPTQTPAFKNWFGESKVVDEGGEPIVVYHGTSDEFTEFDANLGAAKTGSESATMGFFFTDNPKVADLYSENPGPGASFALNFNPDHPLSVARDTAMATPKGRRLVAAAEAEENARIARNEALLDEHKRKLRERMTETGFDLHDDDLTSVAVMMRSNDPRMTEHVPSPHGDRLAEFVNDAIKEAIPSRTMPVYLSIKNPKVYDAQGKTPADFPISERIRAAKEAGHDGVVFKNIVDPDLPSTHYIVFDPNQIKSATGNIGTFDPTDPRITYGIAGAAGAGAAQQRETDLPR